MLDTCVAVQSYQQGDARRDRQVQVWEKGQDELRRELQEVTDRSQRAEAALARAATAYEKSRQEVTQLRSPHTAFG